ncbi:TetR/AcrR family transcriptional regulator [Amycolatopsis sp. CA-230715]|uniref:TetR/AcrR family transcriptional regulator n=1 Tax=Amycolatopsis sp. CA-230715 TaxID=2745196 RepID=UPI001C022A4B|nr:TetR/AcrR family transcriptional regulator [Amycolatopsis sp. CA-230715]QWF83806.1 Tetracycline repressor protein class E [Amycolatopsis sp. CA-230715]
MALDTLSREQIVGAAMELLDAEGVNGLSMRRLGTKLDAGATSIYWHVKNKDALLELASDHAFGEIELPDAAEIGWRAAVTALADGMRSMVLRHPWLVSVFATRLHYGPNLARFQDHTIGVYSSAGFADEELDSVMGTVDAYVLGSALGEAAWHTQLRESNEDPKARIDALMAKGREIAAPYPRLLERINGYGADTMIEDGELRENSFEYGLRAVLDGLEARIPR